MNDFADELRELIDKWREHPGTSDEDIIADLIEAVEYVQPHYFNDD